MAKQGLASADLMCCDRRSINESVRVALTLSSPLQIPASHSIETNSSGGKTISTSIVRNEYAFLFVRRIASTSERDLDVFPYKGNIYFSTIWGQGISLLSI